MNDRPKQEVPAELVDRLMLVVRAQFCGDQSGSEWGKNSHFVKRNVILWPAHFIFNKNGFTLPAARYEQIMREVFLGIKQHGQTGQIRYWPGYLMKCVQDHFKHHWEDYYAEAKAARNIAESTLVALGRLPARQDSTVETMATAQQILAQRAKARRKKGRVETSLPGF